MSDVVGTFGRALGPDPKIAIPKPDHPTTSHSGPVHGVQFVVELVGPRSVLASTASQLLGPQWYAALGQPEAYSMAPADRAWQSLSTSQSGSYDSLVLAWDLISDRGNLTGASAAHLLKTAESFATQIERRAISLPHPSDVDRAVATLMQYQEGLDIGVEILIVPRSSEFLEQDVWIALSELGYDLGSEGFFEFRLDGDSNPLVSVTPTGGQDSFSLGAVQRGVRHPGLLIGFNVPTSSDPAYSLDAAYQTADHLGSTLGGQTFTDDDMPLDASARSRLSNYLAEAVSALKRVGIEPGSPTALKIFGG